MRLSRFHYRKLTYLLTYLLTGHSEGHEEAEEHAWVDGVAILAAVVVVVLVSAVNDWKKERQFRSLQNKIDSEHTFTVVRYHDLVQLPVGELVVGDICLVKYGTSPTQWRNNRACKACSARGPSAVGAQNLPDVF